jgi:nuclear factor of activated T-cells 5
MENDERWCSNGGLLESINGRGAFQANNEAQRHEVTNVRQRLIPNSTLPTATPTQQNVQQGIIPHQSMGRIGSDFLTRSSVDEDASNISSCYDDRSSTFSSDDNALRDRGNEEQHSSSLLSRVSAYVPEVDPSNAVASEAGYFVKANGDTVGAISADELQQQVPVSKYEELELRILRQPEEQHRARYMSEGSRGSVKDRSGKSHVTVALRGYYRPAVLEIYAAVGSGGAPIPHPLYRLIPVTGKNGSSVTSCKEGVTQDGAPCLQVVLRPENKMTAVLDCIGILKICSYDLKRKLPKQNRSASVRLVFRVTVPSLHDRRQNVTLQTVSLPVVCAQQPGYPDVSRISCTSSPVQGNVDVFIVGKNFSNNATVNVKEYGPDGKLVWSAPAVVDQQHIHTCHMICTIPAYRDLYVNKCVDVTLTVECGKKISRSLSFKYLPSIPIAGPVQGQQEQGQVVYDPSYAMDGIGSVPNNNQAQQQQQQQQQPYPKYDNWTGADFSATMQSSQQQYQQQPEQQQQSLLTQQPITDQPVFANTVAVPSTTTNINTSNAKSEPYPDEQNASFYYGNQYSEKSPPAKRFCPPMTNNPFEFGLEDYPQLIT